MSRWRPAIKSIAVSEEMYERLKQFQEEQARCFGLRLSLCECLEVALGHKHSSRYGLLDKVRQR